MEKFFDMYQKSLTAGLLLLFFGIVLFLHTLGLVSVATTLIMLIVSCGLMGMGMVKSGLYETGKNWFCKNRSESKK